MVLRTTAAWKLTSSVSFSCKGMVETITLFMFFQTSDSSTVSNNLEQITENEARLSLFFTFVLDISEKALSWNKYPDKTSQTFPSPCRYWVGWTPFACEVEILTMISHFLIYFRRVFVRSKCKRQRVSSSLFTTTLKRYFPEPFFLFSLPDPIPSLFVVFGTFFLLAVFCPPLGNSSSHISDGSRRILSTR